jgi:hypothetical protein
VFCYVYFESRGWCDKQMGYDHQYICPMHVSGITCIKKNSFVASIDGETVSLIFVWLKLPVVINRINIKNCFTNKLLDNVNVVIYYISSLDLFDLRCAAVFEKGI